MNNTKTKTQMSNHLEFRIDLLSKQTQMTFRFDYLRIAKGLIEKVKNGQLLHFILLAQI